MAGFLTAVMDGGPWALVVLLLGVYLYARHTGKLQTLADVERIERRMEKDTDRVLALYMKQLDTSQAANDKKDQIIAKQAEQIEKLMAHSSVSAHALREIMEEAKRRGMVE